MGVGNAAMAILSPSPSAILVVIATFSNLAQGHEHGHDHIDEGEVVSKDPLVGAPGTLPVFSTRHCLTIHQDAILWAHIFIQMLAYGVIFPIGMVLGV